MLDDGGGEREQGWVPVRAYYRLMIESLIGKVAEELSQLWSCLPRHSKCADAINIQSKDDETYYAPASNESCVFKSTFPLPTPNTGDLYPILEMLQLFKLTIYPPSFQWPV